MAVGASTWASGSQVWNGNIGILMAKPMNSATQMSLPNSMPRSGAVLAKLLSQVSFIRSKVCLAGRPLTSTVGAEL